MPYLIILWSGLAMYSYRHVIGDLLDQWQIHPSYSHGPIVIPIAIWLLWHRRSSRPDVAQPWIAGIGLLLAAHILLWLGGYFYLPAIQRWTIPLWLCGMIGLVWGRGVLSWSLPGVCFLAFMIPVPYQLEMVANQTLQWASAWCSCFLLGLSSTIAVTDGYTIRMETGRVGITSDCSGLRMTVAIAALSYVITFLNHQRLRRDRSGGLASLGLPLHLAAMMLLVIPTAILANAARIAVMAFVVDRYQQESYTSWAHDLGEWLVLPAAAAMFLVLLAWVRSAVQVWRLKMHERQLDSGEFDSRRRMVDRLAPYARIAAGPLAIVLVVAVSIWHYHSQRERIAIQMMAAARSHESNADWDRAAACYQELIYLQSSPDQARYRYAWVSRQSAKNEADRNKVMFQLEAILSRTPFHQDALRTHLDLALELDEATALRSAERLYSLECHDPTTRQMCIEAMLRFHPERSQLPAISVESINRLVEEFGPATDWRHGFVMEVAAFSCRHPEAIDRQLTSSVGTVITKAAKQLGSAEAYFRSWEFDRLFGSGTASLDPALARIDDKCPQQVGYIVYLASATAAWVGKEPDEAKQFLQKAVELIPADHRGYALLGDVCASQREWPESTEAYVRAWRLTEKHSLGLGVKLAESLIRTERFTASAQLVKKLAEAAEAADVAPSRTLRMRLQLVQARLDLHSANYEQALQRLDYVLAAWNRPQLASANQLLSTIEVLQAQCLVRLGRYADAARLFETRAGRSEDATDQWTAAARAWRTAGNASAAQRCYRNAVLQSGEHSEIWLEYVHLISDTRGNDEAEREVMSLTTRMHQGPPVSEAIIAQAWEIVGSSDRAIQHYRSAAQREPKDVAALAIALARRGDVERAIELITDEQWSVSQPMRAHTAAIVGVSADDLSAETKATLMQIIEEGVAGTSDDVPLLLAAVEWYTKSQITSIAMELLHRVVALQPENVIAANNLAMMLADDSRDYQQAIKYIDDVLERSGPVAEFLDTKGWILVQMNRAEEAIPWLTEAADRSTAADPIAQLHLATAYLASGDRDHAWQYLELARASRIRLETLNSSERRAWATLQAEFGQTKLSVRGGDA
jgi:exosortase